MFFVCGQSLLSLSAAHGVPQLTIDHAQLTNHSNSPLATRQSLR